MRRREIFIIIAVTLGVLLWIIQLVPTSWRYLAILGFATVTYFTSALALRKDFKIHHLFTFLPFPTLYSLTIGTFYFLLPENLWSMITILGLFSLGMYAIFLSGNIFSVAQGRTIQLLQAAQNVTLFFAIIISLLGVQVIFSFNWPFYYNFLAISLLHFPLALTNTWSVNLEKKITLENFGLSLFATLIISETALILSFLPLAAWHIALLIMSGFYLLLGILHVFLSEKLFRRAINEYFALAFFIILMFVIFFPGK